MLNITQLPNDLKIANMTPHAITFWSEEWAEPVEVMPSGKVINATSNYDVVGEFCTGQCGMFFGNGKIHTGNECGMPSSIELVTPDFMLEPAAEDVLDWCEKHHVLPVGSIIAAQVYPGRVVAMTPVPGYERAAAPLPGRVVHAINKLIDAYFDRFDPAKVGVDETPLQNELEVLRNAIHAPKKLMNPNKFIVYQKS